LYCEACASTAAAVRSAVWLLLPLLLPLVGASQPDACKLLLMMMLLPLLLL
jgi:hypothetical protein